MPVYEYVCTNLLCSGPKKEEIALTPEEVPDNLPQELIVSMADQEKDQSCRYCGQPAKYVQFHGKSHVRFHFNYLEP